MAIDMSSVGNLVGNEDGYYDKVAEVAALHAVADIEGHDWEQPNDSDADGESVTHAGIGLTAIDGGQAPEVTEPTQAASGSGQSSAGEGQAVDVRRSRRTRDDDWVVRAACRGPQAVVFFPPSYAYERKSDKLQREEIAKGICATCVVREPCQEYALQIREPNGVWGGLSEAERRAILGMKGRRR